MKNIEIKKLPEFQKGNHKIVWSRDSSMLITCGTDGIGRIWDATTGQKISELKSHDKIDRYLEIEGEAIVGNAYWMKDKKRIITIGWDETAFIWDAKNAKKILQIYHQWEKRLKGLRNFGPQPDQILLSEDEKTMATASLSLNRVSLWNLTTGQCIKTENMIFLKNTKGSYNFSQPVWSPDMKWIVTSHKQQKNNLKIVKINPTEELPIDIVFPIRDSIYDDMLRHFWSKDSDKIATYSFDGLLYVWKRDSGEIFRKFSGLTTKPIWSSNGNEIAFCRKGNDGSFEISFFDCQNNKLSEFKLPNDVKEIFDIKWSPNDDIMAIICQSDAKDGEWFFDNNGEYKGMKKICVSIWDIDIGDKIREIHFNSNYPRSMEWSPDGLNIATISGHIIPMNK